AFLVLVPWNRGSIASFPVSESCTASAGAAQMGWDGASQKPSMILRIIIQTTSRSAWSILRQHIDYIDREAGCDLSWRRMISSLSGVWSAFRGSSTTVL